MMNKSEFNPYKTKKIKPETQFLMNKIFWIVEDFERAGMKYTIPMVIVKLGENPDSKTFYHKIINCINTARRICLEIWKVMHRVFINDDGTKKVVFVGFDGIQLTEDEAWEQFTELREKWTVPYFYFDRDAFTQITIKTKQKQEEKSAQRIEKLVLDMNIELERMSIRDETIKLTDKKAIDVLPTINYVHRKLLIDGEMEDDEMKLCSKCGFLTEMDICPLCGNVII